MSQAWALDGVDGIGAGDLPELENYRVESGAEAAESAFREMVPLDQTTRRDLPKPARFCRSPQTGELRLHLCGAWSGESPRPRLREVPAWRLLSPERGV